MAFPILGTPIPQFFNSSGAPLAAGTLAVLEPADDTNKASYPTYDDAEALTNPNDNPITLNSRGEPANGLWGIDGQDYKLTLKDSAGATIYTPDDIFLPVYPAGAQQTTNEATASVTPTNIEYPEYDLRRYGAALDGSTDDQAAIEKVMKVIVANGGGTLTFPPGSHCVCATSLPEISLKTGENGGFDSPLTRSFEIVARGATINYTGTGYMFRVQGTTFSASAPRRFSLYGGSWIGTASADGFIRGRDMGRAAFCPEIITSFSAGDGILVQNWHHFSENMTVTGPDGSTCTLTDNLRSINLQGAIKSGTPNTAPGEATESFARLRVFNIQIGTRANAPVNSRFVVVDGNWYDGTCYSVRGNMLNRDSGATTGTTMLIEMNSGMTETTLYDFKIEGATDATGAQAYIIDATGYAVPTDQSFPSLRELNWSGSGVAPKVHNAWGDSVTNSEFVHHTNVAFDAPISFTGLLSPAKSTGDEDDWAPVDDTDSELTIGLASAIDWDNDQDANRSVTGITTGYEGRLLTIVNTNNSFSLTLKSGDTSSVAANRFLFSEDVVLLPETCILLFYSNSRWKSLSGIGTYAPEESTGTFTAADATPDVSTRRTWLTDTGTLTITDLDGGTAGMRRTIITKGGMTFDTTGTNLVGSSVDLVTASGDVTEWICEDGTTWRLLSFVDSSVDNSAGA